MLSIFQRLTGRPTVMHLPKAPHQPPVVQSLYEFDEESRSWTKIINTSPSPLKAISSLRILSWNIDFVSPLPMLRLQSLLAHLFSESESPLLNNSTAPLPIILIQELHPACFSALAAHKTVRETYTLTDISEASWPKGARYGTVTLVPKSLAPHVSTVFRTRLPETVMNRDALYVDILLSSAPKARIFRVANTHLESLAGHGTRARPLQLASIAQFLTCEGVHAGLVAGDMNDISAGEPELPVTVGLRDAWQDLRKLHDVAEDGSVVGDGNGKGKEEGETEGDRGTESSNYGEDEGHTWGYQPPCGFPPRRLDKVLFVGGVNVVEMERVGVGLKVDSAGKGGDDEDEQQELWVSDHFGLLATIVLVE